MLDGRDTLTTLRYESWEEQVAYIPQDPTIFHASLRENLTFYNPQASDEHLHAVIEKLGLSELLVQLLKVSIRSLVKERVDFRAVRRNGSP